MHNVIEHLLCAHWPFLRLSWRNIYSDSLHIFPLNHLHFKNVLIYVFVCVCDHIHMSAFTEARNGHLVSCLYCSPPVPPRQGLSLNLGLLFSLLSWKPASCTYPPEAGKSGMCQTPQVLCVGAGTHTQSSQLYNKHTLCCCDISAAPELLTFLLLSYTSLYILDTCPIWSHMTCKLFYLIYKLYFSLLDFFWITKFLIVMIVDLCFHFSLILLVLDLRTIT